MTEDQIKAMQTRIGVTPDGFWGPKSIDACKAHLRRFMATPSPWPQTDQKSLTKFYGRAGDESRLVAMQNVPQGLLYEGKQVRTLRCHDKVARSLRTILAQLCDKFPAIAAQYDGCFNDRLMRGGSLPSLHARGAAVDFDPDDNANRQSWPISATMPLEVMEIFAAESWIPAGAFWGRDAMHFQATR